jgi:hypothetical protein
MEKRLLIALGLAAIVILISQKLFPSPITPKNSSADTTVAIGVDRDSIRKRNLHDRRVLLLSYFSELILMWIVGI